MKSYRIIYAPYTEDSIPDWAIWDTYSDLDLATTIVSNLIKSDLEINDLYIYMIEEVTEI